MISLAQTAVGAVFTTMASAGGVAESAPALMPAEISAEDPFAELEVMSDEELIESRGGFSFSGVTDAAGFEVHFGVDIRTILDLTNLASDVAENVPDLAPQFNSTGTDGVFEFVHDATNIEIENTLNNAQFSHEIDLNIIVPNFHQMRGINAANTHLGGLLSERVFLGGLNN